MGNFGADELMPVMEEDLKKNMAAILKTIEGGEQALAKILADEKYLCATSSNMKSYNATTIRGNLVAVLAQLQQPKLYAACRIENFDDNAMQTLESTISELLGTEKYNGLLMSIPTEEDRSAFISTLKHTVDDNQSNKIDQIEKFKEALDNVVRTCILKVERWIEDLKESANSQLYSSDEKKLHDVANSAKAVLDEYKKGKGVTPQTGLLFTQSVNSAKEVKGFNWKNALNIFFFIPGLIRLVQKKPFWIKTAQEAIENRNNFILKGKHSIVNP